MTGTGEPAQRRGRAGRRAAAGAAVALAVLAAADTAAWWVVTGRMQAALPGAVAAAEGDGWRIEATGTERAGWPFRAVLRLSGVTAERSLGTVRLRWTAEAVDLVLEPLAPATLAVLPRGGQTLVLGNGPPVRMRADRMAVLVPLAGGAVDAQATGLALHAADGRSLAVARLDARLDGTAAVASAQGVLPAPAMAPPFDGPATLSVRVLASVPFPTAISPAASALAWQRAGGRLLVPDFSLHLASLSLEGSAEGGLDAALQPDARATLRVQGAGAVLDAAARAGLVASGPATAARAVLELLSAASRGVPVSVPVLLQDRVLNVARFPLLRVPALDWGAVP